MTRQDKPRVPFPFLPIILAMAGGIFLGSISFGVGDSWVNGTNYIYPNVSWSDNVNITGNLTVQGQFVCLADGSNCPNLSGNGTSGPAGLNGSNGTGIVSVYVLSNGSLQINLSDGRNITTGNLTGLKGNTGSSGSDGANGADGVGIAAIYTLNNGSLQVNLTNGVNTTSGNLSGVKGDTGATGGSGSNGIDGLNGTGISTIYVLANGSLQINLTNGTNITSGNLTGMKGDTGTPGGGGSVNGTDVYLNRLNITTASDALITYNSSGFTWKEGMQASGVNYKILDPDGAAIMSLDKNSDSATFLNLIGTASYNGAVPFTVNGASGQTVDLVQVKNSSGSIPVRVNASGTLNASQGLCLGDDGCRTTWPTSGSGGGNTNITQAGNTITINGTLNVTGGIYENGGIEVLSGWTFACTYLAVASATMCYPNYFGTAVTGTATTATGQVKHPGTVNLLSTAAANTGYQFSTSPTAFMLNGSEEFRFSLNITNDTVNNRSYVRVGFFDVFTNAAPVDGVYVEFVSNISGVRVSLWTANNSIRNSTANYTLPISSLGGMWVNGDITINPTAQNVTLELKNDTNGLLWNVTLSRSTTAGIPVVSGRETGAGVLAVRTTAGNIRNIVVIDTIIAELREAERPYG